MGLGYERFTKRCGSATWLYDEDKSNCELELARFYNSEQGNYELANLQND